MITVNILSVEILNQKSIRVIVDVLEKGSIQNYALEFEPAQLTHNQPLDTIKAAVERIRSYESRLYDLVHKQIYIEEIKT